MGDCFEREEGVQCLYQEDNNPWPDDGPLPVDGPGGGEGPPNSECTICCYDPISGLELECEEDPCKTSKEDLKNAFPDAPDSFLGELEKFINKHSKDFNMDSKEKMNHFLSQAAHESTNYLGNSFSALEENLNYRWEKLGTDDFKKYFNPIAKPTEDPTKANPNDFKRSNTSDFVDPEKLANYIYDRKSLGNTEYGDGYKYRGRGIFQLTGKHNYKEFNDFYKEKFGSDIDLISEPHLLSTNTELAVISALWYFENRVSKKINIDKNTVVEKVTLLVNGGKVGLPHRKELFEKAKTFINCL
jgi:putative chitinase